MQTCDGNCAIHFKENANTHCLRGLMAGIRGMGWPGDEVIWREMDGWIELVSSISWRQIMINGIEAMWEVPIGQELATRVEPVFRPFLDPVALFDQIIGAPFRPEERFCTDMKMMMIVMMRVIMMIIFRKGVQKILTEVDGLLCAVDLFNNMYVCVYMLVETNEGWQLGFTTLCI